MQPVLRIPVGVIVERRRATSPWADFVWRPSAVLDGIPETPPWTPLVTAPDAATFYAGAAEIQLYRSETEHYRINLVSDVAKLWVALDETYGDPPYRIAAVTADPAEGEGLTESGQGLVEAVPMPETIRQVISAFVARHHVERPFEKRRRDRADPEALARRGPHRDNDDEP
ncbi:MAG TPA: DUF3305 domain-containing protein [Xanthobacteraceae bacterium]|nr:DUF3305 domain-containing protein [Xanthobacteraceae bacterium]